MKARCILLALLLGGCGSVETPATSGAAPFLARIRVDDNHDGQPDLLIDVRQTADGQLERSYDFGADGSLEMVVRDGTAAGGLALGDNTASLEQTDGNSDDLPDDATVVSADGQGHATEVTLDNDGNGGADERIQMEYNSQGLPIRRTYDDDLDGQADRETTIEYGEIVTEEQLQLLKNRPKRQLLDLISRTVQVH